MKEFRLIYPIFKENKDNEIEMIIQIIKKLSSQTNIEEIVDSMDLKAFEELSQKIFELIDQKKK